MIDPDKKAMCEGNAELRSELTQLRQERDRSRELLFDCNKGLNNFNQNRTDSPNFHAFNIQNLCTASMLSKKIEKVLDIGEKE